MDQYVKIVLAPFRQAQDVKIKRHLNQELEQNSYKYSKSGMTVDILFVLSIMVLSRVDLGHKKCSSYCSRCASRNRRLRDVTSISLTRTLLYIVC